MYQNIVEEATQNRVSQVMLCPGLFNRAVVEQERHIGQTGSARIFPTVAHYCILPNATIHRVPQWRDRFRMPPLLQMARLVSYAASLTKAGSPHKRSISQADFGKAARHLCWSSSDGCRAHPRRLMDSNFPTLSTIREKEIG